MNAEFQKKKKKLGQFFSGKELSNLLAAFVSDYSYLSIIDPMCGTGDLLNAVAKNNPTAELVGIDIDDEITSAAGKTLDNINVFTGSAFSERIIKQLPLLEYDLVITNPPYIRYQSLGKAEKELPTSEEIRKGLLDIIPLFSHLDDREKNIFTSLVKGYSGLADSAVPSWILSAMLSKVGGKLAIIVSESWLTREYALPIHYLLLKLFNIEYVIEDLDREWFKEENAQVKTNLIIAKRVPIVENLSSYYSDREYVHIAITNKYKDEKSFIGKLYPNLEQPELKMFQDIKGSTTINEKGVLINNIKFKDKLENLYINSKDKSWFKSIEQTSVSPKQSVSIPYNLKNEIPESYGSFVSLEELGVRVGQGLRTGANKFFYVDYISESNGYSLVSPDKRLFNGNVIVPNDALKIVIRKQNELPAGFSINSTQLRGRVLVLSKYLHPEDFPASGHYLSSTRKIISTNLAEYISQASNTNIGNDESPKFLYELSAVKPNIKSVKGKNLDSANFWYMLPKLSKRHLPDIFVARVNGKNPKFYMNSNAKVVVDANFSSIWLENSRGYDKYSLLALLNSDWVLLCCELTGSVMGAGALKLEAAHLKKIPIPNLSATEIDELSRIGKRILEGYDELDKVNTVLSRNIFKDEILEGREKIRSMLDNKSLYRMKGND